MSSQSCTACAATSCVAISGESSSSSSKKSTPAGAIAGSVIGGVVFIVIVTFVVWRFCIRNKRREFDEQQERAWSEASEKRSTFATNRSARHSTRSVASTVLTRASNVIQIAYIPGITNRSPPDTPGLLVPPVPPIPIAVGSASASSTPHFSEDQHFFLPSDLARDSTWSGISDDGHRISLSPSLARSSVATTIYGGGVVSPAQQAMRSKPNMVSVKSGSTTPGVGSATTPPVPTLDPKFANSPFVARSVVAKPVNLTKSGSNKSKSTKSAKSTIGESSLRKMSIHHSGFDDTSSEEESDTEIDTKKATPTQAAPRATESPFADEAATTPVASSSAIDPEGRRSSDGTSTPSHRHSRSTGSKAMLETASKRTSRDASPFSDENEIK